MRNADEDPEIGSTFEIEHEPGVFDRFPGRLQEKSMLRIDVGSFPRRDAKKLRIKLIDLVNESAALGDGFAGYARFGVIISLDIPAIGRHLDDAFTAFDEKLPKRVDVEFTPPGKRQPTPMIAIRSFCMVVSCSAGAD